ncbi:DUF1254 domain-containing protein [Roseomonas terrae]|uniref:DUF1254 domain-containing protein n=1 Tax=Neoroseomonas terrae TaxID=424799 RepID=A0ABS5EDF0_9PROT|nr:DUF1254 domain-containing protein [Neoroseomonas terrae]MBR0648747.1 DUF1254 domain-containing protein [Neoroseomonas terrae]
MPEAYARVIGQFAYVWAWPMVNMHNRRNRFDQVPEPGLLDGVAPAAPVNEICMLTDYVDPMERIVATPNQDVVYGFGLLSLDREPVVVQVPDFGDRFWVYQAADQRTDGFAQLGSMYGTRPGLYMLVGPNWQGATPPGINAVFRSPTTVGAFAPRVFQDDTAEDRQRVQPLIRQIMAYPLSRSTGRMQTRDWTTVPRFPAPAGASAGETKWVDPETFFDSLPKVLEEAPPLPGEEAIYGQVRALLDAAKAKPELMAVLKRVAAETEDGLISTLFNWRNQGIPVANGWTTMVNAAAWGTDYLTRASAARANIFSNVAVETRYFAIDLESDGSRLEGSHRYTVTFPAGQLPPVRGFWSLTMYGETHFFERNDLNRYSLGTKNHHLKTGPDGSLTIHVSGEPPEDAAQRTNWLPAPRGKFSLYLRAYWPGPEILDGRWTPPPVRRTS